MAADNVVVAFISTPTGGIYEVDILAGSYYHVSSPGLLAARKAALTQAGVPWNTGSAPTIASYGTEVSQPPNYAALVWAGLVDDVDPKHGPMASGATLATMAWRVLALGTQVAAVDEAVWAASVQPADKKHPPIVVGESLATALWRISDLTTAVAAIQASLAAQQADSVKATAAINAKLDAILAVLPVPVVPPVAPPVVKP